MGWRDAELDPPANRRLVLVVLADGTKEILSWSGSWPWVDQHAVERRELSPYVWHELPPPPPPPPLSPVPPPDPIVHILRDGRSMCGFDWDLDDQRPAGHFTVPFDDPEELRRVNCKACRESYGYPECTICRTTAGGTVHRSRVDRDCEGVDLLKPCVRCEKLTPWMTSGTTTRPWDSPWPANLDGGEGETGSPS